MKFLCWENGVLQESFEALINHQWSFAWYGYCPM